MLSEEEVPNEASSFYRKALVTLWHRVQTFEIFEKDFSLYRLFVLRLVHLTYKGHYRLNMKGEISENALRILVMACEANPALPVNLINPLLL